MLVYEPLHARAIKNRDFKVSDGFYDFLGQMKVEAPEFFGVEEYTKFLDRLAWQRWVLLVDEPRFAVTGVRHLAARLAVAEGFRTKAVQCHLAAKALRQHFEDFEADGLTDQPERHAKACPGDEAQAILEKANELRAEREGHAIEIYRRVDGHALEAHIYQPQDAEAGKPMVLWFHGGGWLTGSWSWCGPCVFFKERGYVVAQIEYRLHGRHGTYIGDTFEDVLAAVRFARERAPAYGADPERIIVAGFSAGGHLSLAAGTLMFSDEKSRPDAVVSISGCTDLASDDFSVRMSGGMDEAKRLSPFHHIRSGMPPTALINATTDHLCDFEEAKGYAEASAKKGNQVLFVPIEKGGHFFLRVKDNQPRMNEPLFSFLNAKGF